MDHMHDDMPPVTVVVVNHNAGPLLADCLRAALAQTRQVVLVDNASEPRPVDDVLGCFPAHSDFDVVRCPVNAGFAAGCNRGLALAREPILLFLNPDCILAAGAVADGRCAGAVWLSPIAGFRATAQMDKAIRRRYGRLPLEN